MRSSESKTFVLALCVVLASTTAASAQPKSRAASLVEQTEALVAGTLDPLIDPQSLFEVDLEDEAALQVEAVRVRAVLKAALGSQQVDAGTLQSEIAKLDSAAWNERVELDRVRLAFYALPADRRSELLLAHAARKPAGPPPETTRERRERAAEAERQQKLEQAHNARSEAERVVAEELARLIALESRVDHVREDVRDANQALRARSENALVWQHRVREAKLADAAASDRVYDALKVALLTASEELAQTLDDIERARSTVPKLEIALDVSAAEQLRTRRAQISKTIDETRKEEAALRSAQASMLLDLMTALNSERLGLLPHLSPSKRAAITRLTRVGWEEARAEARHLVLILRYQRHVVGTWLDSLRSDGAAGLPLWHISMVLVPWLLLILLFSWAQRRTSGLLRLTHVRLAASDRSERRTTPSAALRVVRFLYKVHRPLEWALFFGASLWLLPENARNVLEVQLLATTISWVIGVALVVNTSPRHSRTSSRNTGNAASQHVEYTQ